MVNIIVRLLFISLNVKKNNEKEIVDSVHNTVCISNKLMKMMCLKKKNYCHGKQLLVAGNN